jgi:hypothetical protein
LRAIHEVEHHILKSRLKCTRVNPVKEDLSICAYLYSLISFNKVYRSTLVKSVIVMPVLLFRKFIEFELEK